MSTSTTSTSTTETISQIIQCGDWSSLWNDVCDPQNNFWACKYDNGACIPGTLHSVLYYLALYAKNIVCFDPERVCPNAHIIKRFDSLDYRQLITTPNQNK